MAMVKKSITEYLEEYSWIPSTRIKDEDADYYYSLREDLVNTLMIYRGVRVRDIKSHFELNTSSEVDLDRLNMKSWQTFIIACHDLIEFKLDMTKEEVYLFASEKALTKNIQMMKNIQSMVHGTPMDKDAPKPGDLVTMDCIDVFQGGYLAMANGCPMQDPRIPNQDLGVAATAAWEQEKMKKKKFKNKQLTFDEQIEKANKKQNAKGMKPVLTIESTDPLNQTGSVNDFFSSMDEVKEEEPAPSNWNAHSMKKF